MLEFSLDILSDDDLPFDSLSRLGCRFDVHPIPYGSGIEITIWAEDEKTAFHAVEAVYGPDDGGRETNRFYVFGE